MVDTMLNGAVCVSQERGRQLGGQYGVRYVLWWESGDSLVISAGVGGFDFVVAAGSLLPGSAEAEGRAACGRVVRETASPLRLTPCRVTSGWRPEGGGTGFGVLRLRSTASGLSFHFVRETAWWAVPTLRDMPHRLRSGAGSCERMRTAAQVAKGLRRRSES